MRGCGASYEPVRTVRAWPTPGAPWWDAAGNVVGVTTTGSDGAYAFTDLGAENYQVIAGGYPPVAMTVTVDGRGLEDVHMELAHPEGWSGRTTDDRSRAYRFP